MELRPPDNQQHGHNGINHSTPSMRHSPVEEAAHVRRVEEEGYASPIPIGNGVIESAVAMCPTRSRESGRERRASSVAAVQDAARIEDDVGPPPDGGRQAWLTVLAGFLQQFCIFGMSESRVRQETAETDTPSQRQCQPAGILSRAPAKELQQADCCVSPKVGSRRVIGGRALTYLSMNL